MEPSRRNTNLSATTVVILLLVVVAAEMGSVGAKRAACSHLSGRFSGVCILDEQCEINCQIESADNIGGACDGFPSRCYCQTQCPP
ncbi:hypothetical protein GQ55_6G272700 [Panicum hallii var. hallii]|uniref:Knottins-like domain-containing protein n=1 Tax=Panicum hallii var. hallii TaxID=1504633 RepID=A0A2T7DA56_9POAL|nr:hypothetical protein GQ55_6G272700 [Panicum hallii var. hallii]